MNMSTTPHAINTEAVKKIKEYCENRHYKCKGCRFNTLWGMGCVFANCPCDWEIEDEDK